MCQALCFMQHNRNDKAHPKGRFHVILPRLAAYSEI